MILNDFPLDKIEQQANTLIKQLTALDDDVHAVLVHYILSACKVQSDGSLPITITIKDIKSLDILDVRDFERAVSKLQSMFFYFDMELIDVDTDKAKIGLPLVQHLCRLNDEDGNLMGYGVSFFLLKKILPVHPRRCMLLTETIENSQYAKLMRYITWHLLFSKSDSVSFNLNELSELLNIKRQSCINLLMEGYQEESIRVVFNGDNVLIGIGAFFDNLIDSIIEQGTNDFKN